MYVRLNYEILCTSKSKKNAKNELGQNRTSSLFEIYKVMFKSIHEVRITSAVLIRFENDKIHREALGIVDLAVYCSTKFDNCDTYWKIGPQPLAYGSLVLGS